jgi:hypothetical protein
VPVLLLRLTHSYVRFLAVVGNSYIGITSGLPVIEGGHLLRPRKERSRQANNQLPARTSVKEG